MSLTTRVIARLDLKPSLGVVKGCRMDGLRRIGPAGQCAIEAEDQGADELLLLDVTASLYGRPPAWAYLLGAVDALHTPVAYGGGVRSLEDFARVIRTVGEKCALNTAALARPGLITECAEAFGSQAVVVSIEAKKSGQDWLAYTHGGRQPSGWKACDWAQEAVALGAGEILLTSVDRDGTQQGYDVDLIAAVRARVPGVPLIASGGLGEPAHAVQALQAGASAVAVASYLHAGGTVGAIKQAMAESGVEVRV